MAQPIKCKAAVAWKAKSPLQVVEIIVDPPKAGEIRVKVISNAICHTDVYTLDGLDPEGKFPCILGHEATAIVESIGQGVKSVSPGDVVIPCYTPECREPECIFCASSKTNLCPKIRATQGQGVMPDGTTRFHTLDGKDIFHFMGTSTFSEYTVISEISAAKINPRADLSQVCLVGCGVATGWGAVFNTTKIPAGSSVGVFGLGAVGLSVIQAAKQAGARKIVGFDINPKKFQPAKEFGATDCFDSSKGDQSVKDYVYASEKWGLEFTFDCTGNVAVMRTALEIAHRGWGESCVIGVAASGKEIATRPFNLIIGKKWKGTAFGGWKSRSDVPKLVNKVLINELSLAPFVTHTIQGLENVNKSIEYLHSGDCLRAVVEISKPPAVHFVDYKVKVLSSTKSCGGAIKRVSHFSPVLDCDMIFTIFLPTDVISEQRGPEFPVLYYLSGLTCTDQNAPNKSGFAPHAAKYRMAMVFPDTSPRKSIPGDSDNWDFGQGAGFYVNATKKPWAANYKMYSYVTEELPAIVSSYFPVDGQRMSITGHSMGGHGALVAHLRNPGKYCSVSALAPIANPSQCPWGQKAFKGYLGSLDGGAAYDATNLVSSFSHSTKPCILIDQGLEDKFYSQGQLLPENFKKACSAVNYPLKLNLRSGYDHSYSFVASFIGDHIEHHAKGLDC